MPPTEQLAPALNRVSDQTLSRSYPEPSSFALSPSAFTAHFSLGALLPSGPPAAPGPHGLLAACFPGPLPGFIGCERRLPFRLHLPNVLELSPPCPSRCHVRTSVRCSSVLCQFLQNPNAVFETCSVFSHTYYTASRHFENPVFLKL